MTARTYSFPIWPRLAGWWAPTCGRGVAHVAKRHVVDGGLTHTSLCGQSRRGAGYVPIEDPRQPCRECLAVLRRANRTPTGQNRTPTGHKPESQGKTT